VEFAAAERPVVPKAACDVQFCAAEIELPPKRDYLSAGPPRRVGAQESFCNVSTPGGRA